MVNVLGGDKRSHAGDVVVARMRDQLWELQLRDRAVRIDAPDSVHKMRVASRRLRSQLKTFRPLFERGPADPLRAELKWLATLLGAVRDAEVIRSRLECLAHEQPAHLLVGPVRQRIEEAMTARYRAARQVMIEELDGDRYLRLLQTLDSFLAEPPLTKKAARPARRALPRLARRSVRDVRRSAARVDQARTQESRELLLHQVRKDAKRARYAAEALRTTFGKPAKRLSQAMESVQEVLGEYRDGGVARNVLRELGLAAHSEAENGFTYGLMVGRELARAEEAERSYPIALRTALARRQTRWTRP